MLIERALERIASIDGDARGHGEIGEAAPSHHERQRVFERLKAREKPVPLDRDPRTGGRGPRLLQIGDDPLELDDAALVPAADPDVGIDDHDGLDLWRKLADQEPERPRLVTVQLLVEAAPAGLY